MTMMMTMMVTATRTDVDVDDGDTGRKAAVEVVRAAPQKWPHFQMEQISRRYLEISRPPLNARNISIPEEKYFPHAPNATNLKCPFMGA